MYRNPTLVFLPQELWPSLLEKAYASIHGGYPALASGSVADALVDLTGGMLAAKVNLSQEAQMADAAAGELHLLLVLLVTGPVSVMLRNSSIIQECVC